MIDSTTRLKTRHRFSDYLYWNLVFSVPIITACIAIAGISILWFIVYLVLCIALIVIVYRFYCTDQDGATVQGGRSVRERYLDGKGR